MRKSVSLQHLILCFLLQIWLITSVIKGLPFRQAHHVVGELVGLAESKGVSLTAISDEEASGVSEFLTGEWLRSV